MGSTLGNKRSSKQPQENSKIVKESILPTQCSQNLTHMDMMKAKRCIHRKYGDLPPELGEQTNTWNLVQRKTPENSPQLSVLLKATKDDELVRYMSKLPGYLHRGEKVENIQDKALNVGVLDWGRLENWKCNQMGVPLGIGNDSSLPCSKLSAQLTTESSSFHNPRHNGSEIKKHPSISCRSNSSNNRGISRNVKSSIQDPRLFQDVENTSTSQFGQKRAVWNNRPFDRNSSDASSGKGKRSETGHEITSKVGHQLSNSKYEQMLIGSKESVSAINREAKQSVEQLPGSDIKRKVSKQNFTPDKGTSSEPRNFYNSPSIKEMKNVDNRGTKKKIELQEPAFDLPTQHQLDEKKNIVVLVPRKFSRSSSQKQPRKSLDEKVTDANQNSMSDDFPGGVAFLPEFHHEIPHSCPLPSSIEYGAEQNEMAHDVINTQDAGASSDTINMYMRGNLDETPKKFEQETAGLAAGKGRHPSPNRRFSFSLSRMTRSFSFKESSAVPQLSPTYVSVKSGPVASNTFAGIDTSNREKGSGHNRARSSPLRRILDPLLLKSKGVTSSGAAETDQLLTRSLSSYSFNSVTTAVSLRKEKYEASNIQAQLVLTISNGFPLFRFVVNSNIIVAAPVKNIMPSGKNDAGCNYLLYSIDEVKRKSGGWMNQSIKEKRCGFVYNVMGQMKVSSLSSLDVSGSSSNSQYMVTESILFGVELRQGQASPQLTPNTELAAVEFKMPNRIQGFDVQHRDKEANAEEKGFSWDVPENEQYNSCTVILPGGIHSLPKTGVPSSLIHRWRSGGSCDCGGWDIGCKLRVLSNENQHQKLSRTSHACPASDFFQLFLQGEAQRDRPVFSMAPFEKGKYSVEFCPSISLLQAFFICMSVISCQRLCDIPKVSDESDEKVIPVNDGMKTIYTNVLKETPVKYAPCPPVSPVGRA